MVGATSHTQKDKLVREELATYWYTGDMSRTRVYPQDISATVTLTPDAAANTFGNWTLIIPADIVPFDFIVNSLQTEGVGGADSFFIQLSISPAPSGNQYLGEKRFNLGAAGRARVQFHCPEVLANTPVYGRVKTGAGGTTINVSVSVVRCICTTDMKELLATKRNTWPW